MIHPESAVEDLVEQLWHAPHLASRNRGFERFQTPVGKRALRAYRLLRSLHRDIVRRDTLRAEVHVAQRQVTLCLADVHAKRTAVLSPRLFALLMQNPAVSRRLQVLRSVSAS